MPQTFSYLHKKVVKDVSKKAKQYGIVVEI